MALETYLMGPSGGTGGTDINPKNVNKQPRLVDTDYQLAGTLDNLLVLPDCQIREIIVHAGYYIYSITVSYVGAKDIQYGSYKMGGDGGQFEILQLSDGEYINSVSGLYVSFVEYLNITTNLGRALITGSTTTGPVTFNYSAPPGYEIIGFWGSAGGYVDRLGVVIRLLNDPTTSDTGPK